MFGKCAPCVILLSLPSPADLSPLLSVSLHSRSESPRKHRWSASPFARTAQVILALTELLDQGSGLWPSMQLVSVTWGPHTPEMSLQTDVVWDLWCAATRVSVTVLLTRSSSCLFLVWNSTICLISCRCHHKHNKISCHSQVRYVQGGATAVSCFPLFGTNKSDAQRLS